MVPAMARRKKSSSQPSDSPPKNRYWVWFKRLFWTGLAIGFIGFVALATSVWIAMQSLPSFDELKQSPNGQTIRVHAADGSIMMTLGPTYGRWLKKEEIPQIMTNAMVAVEDRRFYSHLGVDPVGVARSSWVAVQNRGTGRRMQGASTITQQLARNVFLTNSYTYSRKLREAILALAMERKFSKDQILELYLNKVYFGGGSYGIDAASRRFFNHSATSLSLSEAAIIAGLVKAPSRYSPTADAEAAVDRAKVVLQVMQDAGAITPGQAVAANPVAVELAPEPMQTSARYFTDWALPQLDMLIDETAEPLDVWTTLDPDLQRSATASLKANAPRGVQGALVSLDRDGAVLAMVGGTDYVTSNYNRATKAVRQPGSAWKVFVYMAALEAGYKVNDMVDDKPVTIKGWSPRNSSGRFSGEVSLRTAFAYSLNTVAAQLGEEVGYSSVANMAKRFGITTPINTHPSMVLGTSEVRVIDMARAVAGISAKGAAITPYGITKVTTADGKLLYNHAPEKSAQLIDPWVAAGITDLMQTAVNTGTGRAAQIGRPVAGKTGTTSSNKDGWFVGFSSGVTTAVWMGRDDSKAVGNFLQGGKAPAKAFADYMRVAVAKRPVEQFDTQVTLPEWQLEADEPGTDFGAPGEGQFVDENGMPIQIAPEAPGIDNATNPDGPPPSSRPDRFDRPERPDRPEINQDWIDNVTGRRGNGEGGTGSGSGTGSNDRDRAREFDRDRNDRPFPPNAPPPKAPQSKAPPPRGNDGVFVE